MSHRSYNIGKSNYAEKRIQPWDIWKEYDLNPWDADIVKRVLRTKAGEGRVVEYEKIKHICEERIWQLTEGMADERPVDERLIPGVKSIDIEDKHERKVQYNGTHSATATPEEGYEKTSEEIREAPTRDTTRSASEWEDTEFSNVLEEILKDFSRDPEVSIERHSLGGNTVTIVKRHRSKLSSSEEPATERELRPDCCGREPQMDREISEAVSAMERFEEHIRIVRHDIQLGNIDAGDVRQLVSNLVAFDFQPLEKL